MGFFKKIGKTIKKATRQISLKNAVKIGTPLLSAIPVVGGLAQNVVGGISDAHEAKKAQRAAEQAGNAELAQAYAEQVKYAAAVSGGQMGTVAGGIVKQFANNIGKATVEGAYDGVGDGVKQGLAKSGASMGNMVLSEWLKKHWWKLVAGIGAVGAVIFFAVRSGRGKTARRR